jgi:hypothetical protein
MQTVHKYLVYEYLPIMEKTFRSGTRDSCVAQRSIYVILRGNEETRSYITQVRNLQRRLFFSDVQTYIATKVTQFEVYPCLYKRGAV